MKFRIIVAVLTITIIGLFAMVVYQAAELSSKNKDLEVTLAQKDSMNVELQAAKDQLRLKEDEAQTQLDSLRKIATSDIWNYTKETNTLKAYTNYYKDNGEDEHFEDIIDALKGLLTESGYVQIKESGGKLLFTEHEVPGLGDFLIAETDRSVRNGVIGANRELYQNETQNTSRNGDVILLGQIVKEVGKHRIPSGKTMWAKIEYGN